jgi:lipopolysaccharide/colanic/teichoic acid biosynthesis glycosyltransferase
MDLVICIAAMPVLAPILIACAIAVRMDSPGPVLFRQQRSGRHGVRFGMFKFRTMVANAVEL